ncbi:hypothetical protein D9M68_894190 [compost metagenome]
MRMVQVVGAADRHVVQRGRGVALELLRVFVEAFELSEELALRRDAVDDADRIVDVVGHRQMVIRVLDGTHVARSDVTGSADEGKVFHVEKETRNDLQAEHGEATVAGFLGVE